MLLKFNLKMACAQKQIIERAFLDPSLIYLFDYRSIICMLEYLHEFKVR